MNDDKAKSVSPHTVADYLRNNPHFFNEHPELLTQLHIPHPTGDAVSLVERQMSLLREQNEKTRQKLDELIDVARANEELARRMHMLALTLMDASEPQEIFNTLYENLQKHFHADCVAMRVFAAPAVAEIATGREFAGDDPRGLTLFKSIIAAHQPVCGSLESEQQVYLFGEDGAKLQSGVVVPLHGEDWSGIMAIGSYDAERFHPGLGVELLSNLGEIVSIIVKPWVSTGAHGTSAAT